MKAIKKLRTELEAVGAKLDEYDYSLCCDAPKGYVWRANSEPCISIQFGAHGQTWLTDALKDGYSRLKMGLEKVTDEKELKEIQFSLDDDSWIAEVNSPEFISFPAN